MQQFENATDAAYIRKRILQIFPQSLSSAGIECHREGSATNKPPTDVKQGPPWENISHVALISNTRVYVVKQPADRTQLLMRPGGLQMAVLLQLKVIIQGLLGQPLKAMIISINTAFC